MDELVQWLREQLDLDAARQQSPFTRWHDEGCASQSEDPEFQFPCDCGEPARLLADIDAKRWIVEAHTADFHWCPMGDAIFKALALPYADRPGYRDDWRP